MTRRKLIYGFLAGSATSLAYPCYLEPRWLAVSRHEVRFPGKASTSSLRILHLSDLHYSATVPLSLIDSAVTLGLAEKPDLVCVTGDFITEREDLTTDRYVRVLARLSAAAPAYAVLGNHDGGLWAGAAGGYQDHRAVETLLERSGIRLLHNASVLVSARGASLRLVGVGDLWSEEIDAKAAFRGLDPQGPVVLMSHNPDSKDVLGDRRWDLMLSGHTHGGQVILPFDGPRFAPVRDKRYVDGLKAWGDRQIHVTRGVGNVVGVRFRCRPEVSLLTVSA